MTNALIQHITVEESISIQWVNGCPTLYQCFEVSRFESVGFVIVSVVFQHQCNVMTMTKNDVDVVFMLLQHDCIF